jgi:hypothetical protein
MMDIADHIVVFYLHDRDAIYDFERIQRVLQTLATKGFYVFANAESEKIWPLWCERTRSEEVTEVQESLQAGVSSLALSEAKQFCATKALFCALQGVAIAPEVYSKNGKRLLCGFEWGLGFDREQGVVYISYLRHYFTAGRDEWEAYHFFLEMTRLIYTIWHPMYGYTLDMRGGEAETPRDEILAYKISYLYEINLYGPQIVEMIGRERVESAPAQIVTPLDDGGILLVPCENLLPDFYRYSYSAAARHLGLVPPYRVGNAPTEA